MYEDDHQRNAVSSQKTSRPHPTCEHLHVSYTGQRRSGWPRVDRVTAVDIQEAVQGACHSPNSAGLRERGVDRKQSVSTLWVTIGKLGQGDHAKGLVAEVGKGDHVVPLSKRHCQHDGHQRACPIDGAGGLRHVARASRVPLRWWWRVMVATASE